MELNKNEKEKCWNDTKINILLILIVLFPIIVVVFSGEIAKTMSTTRTHIIIASLPFVLFIEIIFLSLLTDCAEKYEMLKKQEKLDEQLNKELQQIEKEHEENIAAHNYVFSEIEKHNYTMTYELLRITMLKGPEMRKEFETYVRSNPPKDFAPENFNLNKNTEAPGVNPILSDLINQIQTHGDNIIVKQQGQQLTIKATLNQNNQNKNNQWGEF